MNQRHFLLFSAFLLLGCVSDTEFDEHQGAGGDGVSGGTGGSAGSNVGGGGQDVVQEPLDPGPMRLVSWNCHNFFDDRLGNCLGYCPYEERLTPGEYKTKIAGIARGLKELAGDVVLLQEVENKEVLDALATHPDLADLGYETREIMPGNDPRGITIGLLSRVPIDKYISHKDDKFTRIDDPAFIYSFARDATEIRLMYRGYPVGIVNVHFKARINDEDPDRRVAEAQQARAIADGMRAANPDTYVFVVGDFNDTPGTDTYQAVRNGPKSDSEVYEHALASIPTAERYSYVYGSQNHLLDHILASPNVGPNLIQDSATILHDTTLPSDHRAIAATYWVP